MSTPSAAPVALVTCRALPDLTKDDRLLIEPLRAAGIPARAVSWDDPGADWAAFGCAVIRSTWDYHARPEAFRAWIDRCESAGARLWNSPSVLRWNIHKSYLRTLAEAGVPVVPTAWIERRARRTGERKSPEGDLRGLLEARGWERAVVKPAISAGARRTMLVTLHDAAESQPMFEALAVRGDVLVQPFLEGVVGEGEWSFLFLGGAFSHAVLKRPASGDFRVQERFGGSMERAEPPPGFVERAEAVLAALPTALPGTDPAALLYARVDGVREGDRLLLVELEVLEPSLFLALEPAAPDRLAAAVAGRVT